MDSIGKTGSPGDVSIMGPNPVLQKKKGREKDECLVGRGGVGVEGRRRRNGQWYHFYLSFPLPSENSGFLGVEKNTRKNFIYTFGPVCYKQGAQFPKRRMRKANEVVSLPLPIPCPASSSPGSNLYKEAPAPRTPFSASSPTNEKIRPNGVRYPINPRRRAH